MITRKDINDKKIYEKMQKKIKMPSRHQKQKRKLSCVTDKMAVSLSTSH